MPDAAPQTNYSQKLSVLIDGYHGYHTPKRRVATAEIFEVFLSEKLKTILRILEERYSEWINHKKNLHLIMPLSVVIKNLTASFEFVTYEKSQRHFFLHEYRFPWPGVEDKLYKMDYNLLQYISMLVDKLSHFEQESTLRFENLGNIVVVLKDKLSERKRFIYEINEKLAPVNRLLDESIRQIRERHISEETFRNMEKAMSLFPDRMNTFMEIFGAFQRYSAYYVHVTDNIPLVDFFSLAFLFLLKYKQYTQMLQQYLNRAAFETDEEKEGEAYLRERVDKAPDFNRLAVMLNEAKQIAEKKQSVMKEKEKIMSMATEQFRIALRMERDFRFEEAIAYCQRTLSIDKDYTDAMEAMERIRKKWKVFSVFSKARKKLEEGNVEKAKSLLAKVLKNVPEFEEAKTLLQQLEQGGAGEKK
jgi:hypothetical protein